MRYKDITGNTYGRLTVISVAGKNIKHEVLWNCECTCGKKSIKNGCYLRDGATKSCGCLAREVRSAFKGTLPSQPFYNTKIYRAYYNMISRCNNKKHPRYDGWGGRGIRCLWSSFDEFKKDMYNSFLEHEKKYGGRNTSIDRINNDGDYCKENCRWVTQKEQCNNTRRQKLYKK